MNHRDTEDTERVVFSLAGRRRPGKRASAFGGSSFSRTPTVSRSTLILKNLPEGLCSFARSSSPERAKNDTSSVLSVPLWLTIKVEDCATSILRSYPVLNV
jgi:hypothetical protein